jgi:hypothetical protein
VSLTLLNVSFKYGIFLPPLALIRYQLLSLELASLYLTTAKALKQYSYLPYSSHHWIFNSTISDKVQVTCLKVNITVTTKTLALVQYSYLSYSWHHWNINSRSSDEVQLLALQLASLKLQQYKLWWNSYIPYIWHHCTYNNTSSDAVELLTLYLTLMNIQLHKLWWSTVTCPTVGITEPSTAQAVMKYSYIP